MKWSETMKSAEEDQFFILVSHKTTLSWQNEDILHGQDPVKKLERKINITGST
jgi:hypothetical protein